MKLPCSETLQLNKRKKIKTLFALKDNDIIGIEVTLCGWIKTVRNQKSFTFLEVNDGSTLKNMQVIIDESIENYANILEELSTGAAVTIDGKMVKSPGKNQSFEMKAKSLTILGLCPSDYPLQKKRHSFDFLRTIGHLRPRTNTQGAIARVRNRLAYATHSFFQKNGFIYLQSPILTSSDCEGAGELFQVTTLNLENPPKKEDQTINYSKDFFSKPAYLTVSGQMNAESYALALSDVYTFGPTFRAENSHTSRHLSEFWMIEPEIAFADLSAVCSLAENFLKTLTEDILENCTEDLNFFNQFIEKGLIERLESIVKSPFAHLTYSEAIKILEKVKEPFQYPVKWGCDLQTEHERFLTEHHCKSPLIVTDYPKEIKSFYMRANNDEKTVAGFDLLVPKIGEIIGGSQREERYDRLKAKIEEKNLDLSLYSWYLDLRKYGGVPHGGFGLGFERFVQLITGTDNIRDAIAFPRVQGSCEF